MTSIDPGPDLSPSLDVHIDGTDSALAAVEQWLIEGVGRRPSDFLARDLLIASALRDPQQWLFRCMSSDPPPWIDCRTCDIDDNVLRKQAAQLSALHFLHAIQLDRLSENLEEPHKPIVERLQRCVPFGMLVRPIEFERPDERDICDLARQCPWCLARRVVGLYRRLLVLHPENSEGVLFLARVSVSDEAFATSGKHTLHQKCRLVRARLGPALIRDAQAIGSVGGLVSFMVAPRLSEKWTGDKLNSEGNAGFEFRLAVLGRIPADRAELAMLQNSGRGPAVRKFDELGTSLAVDYQLLRGSQALRIALAGSSCGYEDVNEVENVTGIFSWPRWNLADPGQWAAHLEATKHMRLFDPWGNLKAPLSETGSQYHATSASIRHRPKTARGLAALERREILFQQFEAFLARDPAYSNYGFVKLRKLFKEERLQMSERDAKWLRVRLLRIAADNNGVSDN